ncbi:MAG: cobalt ECF transporter T component CbiQ [Proteobacteria bacterium]|nr:cobalt ECF transporter T component CbiQ [Pseudomonadota bacterium]MBU1737215.1 cobalt ECF transporter T component CbiQ [Pseudomonadota bacterium]
MTPRLETAFYDIGRLDSLSQLDTPAHRLDPRAKVATTFFFVVAVVSCGKYEIAALLPFFLFPAAAIGLANLPTGYLLRKLLLVSPFVLFIGIFNPILDRETLMNIAGLDISGGWISFASLVLKFMLTVGAALLLIATTGFPAICMALNKLGAPRIFTVQLLMLYRYLFVLIEEGIRMIRAHSLRSFSGRRVRLRTFLQLLGNLLLRTLDRAQRIHMAMLSRAFTGEIHLAGKYNFKTGEALFLMASLALIAVFRFTDITRIIGSLILEVGP